MPLCVIKYSPLWFLCTLYRWLSFGLRAHSWRVRFVLCAVIIKSFVCIVCLSIGVCPCYWFAGMWCVYHCKIAWTWRSMGSHRIRPPLVYVAWVRVIFTSCIYSAPCSVSYISQMLRISPSRSKISAVFSISHSSPCCSGV